MIVGKLKLFNGIKETRFIILSTNCDKKYIRMFAGNYVEKEEKMGEGILKGLFYSGSILLVILLLLLLWQQKVKSLGHKF